MLNDAALVGARIGKEPPYKLLELGGGIRGVITIGVLGRNRAAA